MLERQVVATGIGVVSPMDHGQGIDVFWSGLCNGNNAITSIKLFDVQGHSCQVGGQIIGFNGHSRCKDLFESACRQALEDSGLDTKAEENIGIYFGTILGGIDSGQRYMDKALFQDKSKDSSLLRDYTLHSIPADIAKKWHLTGPNLCVNTACSSSGDAIALAANEIKTGRADIMLVGGADILSEFMFRGFSALQALTKEGLVRPFDKNRTGLAISEGAGVIILEELNHAKLRQAKVYGELLGFASTIDAYHLIRPHKDGKGLSQAISVALQNAGITHKQVDYINAHGTGTIFNDASETKAIKLSFGKNAKNIKISSIKSMIGHTMGASSIIEIICCLKVMEYNVIPPTINYETPDPECDLDYVPNVCCNKEVNVAMSLSAGFGGQNNALIFKSSR